jgi:two-component system, LytTR family, response regulator
MEHNTPNEKKRISWPTRNGFVFTDFDDVLLCQADGSYTKVTLNSDSLVVSYKLKVVEEMLGGLPFFRVHDSSLVNLNYASALVREDGVYTLVVRGHNVTVAKARKKALMDCFCGPYKLK